MLDTLFTLINTKIQYEIQRRTGGVAILGFAIIFLMVWKWDEWFYPVFDLLGLAYIIRESGMVVNGLPALTAFNVLALIFCLMVAAGVLIFLSTILPALGLFLPKPLQTLVFVLVMILMLPITIPMLLISTFMKPKAKAPVAKFYQSGEKATPDQFFAAKPELNEMYQSLSGKKDNHRTGLMYLEQTAKTYRKVPFEEAKDNLNQAINPGNPKFTFYFGYNAYLDRWFLLTNNPLPQYCSHQALKNNGDMKTHSLMVANTELLVYPNEFSPIATNLFFKWNENWHYYDMNFKENWTQSEEVFTMALSSMDIYEVQTTEMVQLSSEVEKKLPNLYRKVMETNELAFFTPTYWNEVIKNRESEKGSYYTEFAKVKHSKEYAKYYREANVKWLTALVKQHDAQAAGIMNKHYLPKDV